MKKHLRGPAVVVAMGWTAISLIATPIVVASLLLPHHPMCVKSLHA
jgi:hypothetical protein